MVDKSTTNIGKKKYLVKKPNNAAKVMVGITAVTATALAAYIILTLQLLSPVQQYPVVGGNWQSDFNVTGTADLMIYSVKPTVFDTDLTFLGLTCNGIEVPYTSKGGTTIGKYYKWANYSCNGISSWKVKVLTIGEHHQMIKFGQITQDVYNKAFELKDFGKLSKTDCGVVKCHSEIELTNPIDTNRSFKDIFQSVRFEGMVDKLVDWGIDITYDKNETVLEPVFTIKNLQYFVSKSDLNGQKCENYGYDDYNFDSCSFFKEVKVIGDYTKSIKTVKETKSFSMNDFKGTDFYLVPGQKVILDIWGERKASLKETSVDWIPTISGYEAKEWAWWNTNWAKKKPIIICANTDLNVNQIIWIKNIDFSSMNVQANLADVRVVNERTNTELIRKPEGTNASIDGNIFFVIDQNILKGVCDTNFVVYYQNSLATAPTDAFSYNIENFERYSVGQTIPFGSWYVESGTGANMAIDSDQIVSGSKSLVLRNAASQYAGIDWNVGVSNYDNNLGNRTVDYNVWAYINGNSTVYFFVEGDLNNSTTDVIGSIAYQAGTKFVAWDNTPITGTVDVNHWYKLQVTLAWHGYTHNVCVYQDTATNLVACVNNLPVTGRGASAIPDRVVLAIAQQSVTWFDDLVYFAPYQTNVSLGTEESNASQTDVNNLSFRQIDSNSYFPGNRIYIIDFNITDKDNNAVSLNVDINLNSTRTRGGITILNDGNFARTPGLFCDTNDLKRAKIFSTACHYIMTTPIIFDGNLVTVIDINSSMSDKNLTFSNTSFFLDNNKPKTNWNKDTNRWYQTTLTINLTATDSSNNVPTTAYRYCRIIPGDSTCTYGDWTTYSSGFSIGFAGDGNYRFDFNSTDKAGNVGDENINYLWLDFTAPTIVRGDLNSWSKLDQNVQFTITDNFSGCKYFTKSVDDVNTIVSCNGNGYYGIVVNNDGNHRVVYHATDYADNNSTRTLIYVPIDKTPPTVSIRKPQDQNLVYASNTIEFDVNETLSPITKIFVDLNKSVFLPIEGSSFNKTINCTDFNYSRMFYCIYSETYFNIGDHNSVDYNVNVKAISTIDLNGSHSHIFKWLTSPDANWGNVNENYLTDIGSMELFPGDLVDQNVIPLGQNDINGYFQIGNTSSLYSIRLFFDLNQALPNDSNMRLSTKSFCGGETCMDVNAIKPLEFVIAPLETKKLWVFFDLNMNNLSSFDFVLDYRWSIQFTS